MEEKGIIIFLTEIQKQISFHWDKLRGFNFYFLIEKIPIEFCSKWQRIFGQIER